MVTHAMEKMVQCHAENWDASQMPWTCEPTASARIKVRI